MAAVSFTYNGDYDPKSTVVLSQNALDFYNGPSGNHTLGPFFNDIYIMNDDGYYGVYGAFFVDSQRFDGDPADQNNKPLTGSEYSISLDLSDNTGYLYLSGSNFGDILRAGSGADTLNGGGGNDLLEGGAGADIFDGGTGINTVTYAHSSEGVTAVLSASGRFGDAEGDTYSNIQNITGSQNADLLQGDEGNNVLRGNGGLDQLYGMGGDDRLVFSGDATVPAGMGQGFLDGGDDKDTLFLTTVGLPSASVVMEEGSISNIEQIYVRGDVHLDMSAVTDGQRITSQSTDGHAASITGTAGKDIIRAGKGGDVIDGSAGADKIFAGAGSDTFHFTAGFGRDNVFGFTAGTDHFDVSALVSSFGQISIRACHGGADTLITFDGAGSGNKIILHDVVASSLHADDFGFIIT